MLHTCLADSDQSHIPTTDAEKDELYEAGLGEKEIAFDNLDMTGEEFRELLYTHFPTLKDGGGFQLCKCIPNSRNLQPLSKGAFSSLSMLKQRVGNARTYIRPVQRDLNLTPVVNLPDAVSACTGCCVP